MKYRAITNNTNKFDTFNTSRIYFEIGNVDTFSTKFINIDAKDYTKLEKAYTKNISILIKYLDNESKENIKIGTLDLTCFDLYEALSDNVNIKEILDAEGIDTFNIYSAIINNFNKDYYDYFGYKDERNIANITNISLNTSFQNSETVYYILKNIHKIVYHLLGLKISTILSLKKLNCLNNKEDIMVLYTNLGFLEIDNESDFVAKNINTCEIISQDFHLETLLSNQVLISEFKNILANKKNLKDILEGNA